jgi:hypothetical protein
MDYLEIISPFSISYKRRLKAAITTDNQQSVLQYIVKSISDEKADNIFINDMRITYKGSTSGRGSLYSSVDDGIFDLIFKDNMWWLIYTINMRKLFITTGIMAGFFESFSLANGGPWWIGLVAFAWLCGGNWVFSLLRHGSAATELSAGINELIDGKIEQPEIPDKMTGPLKSWF